MDWSKLEMKDPLEWNEADSVLADMTRDIKKQIELVEAAICSDIAMILIKHGLPASQKLVKVRLWEMIDLDWMFSTLNGKIKEGASDAEIAKTAKDLIAWADGVKQAREELIHRDYPYGDE